MAERLVDPPPRRPAWLAGKQLPPANLNPPEVLRALAIQPWDQQPIPTAVNFFTQELDNLNLGAAAGASVVTTLAGGGALRLPPNNIGVITSCSWFASGPTTATNIVYTVRRNRSPIRGLTNLKFPPQNAAFLNFSVDGTWDLSAGSFVDVLITRRIADVATLVNFTLVGWFCPIPDVIRWTGQVPGQVG
jgi:hypothetical protein